MYDAGKVIAGVIIFLLVVLSPFWYNTVSRTAGYVPELELATDAKECVEATPYMKTSHVELLNSWKEEVVRIGKRAYSAQNGKTYAISLTDTCLHCHFNKAEFCDRCHNYTGVKPVCWDCHIVPKAVMSEKMDDGRTVSGS